MDADLLLAIQLQEQFDSEYQSPLSIVDESWETLDPSPDVRAMFLEFNDTFFWGKLCGVEVKWSPRMTLCAGVCSYEGRGGLCSIRLSEPLLKLRPRKDLVETLLHEMIHALLFVTQNNKDRDGHGPEFCKHMNRINTASGTNITVYHSFHDEVDVYRQHWWRCDGPCQTHKPFFGYVKRAMNRAPSSLDFWWADHQRTCGGTYTKIKEPEGYGKKGKKDGKKNGKTTDKETAGTEKPSSSSAGKDIRNIIPFSGKGFLLGGQSQSSTPSLQNPAVPVMKVSSPIPNSPLKKPLPSPSKTLSTPVHYNHDNSGSSIGPRRSVSNTRVFVNINGSPVRISKPHRSSSSKGAEKIRQKSIQDLFNSTGAVEKSTSGSATSPKPQSSTSSCTSKTDPSTSQYPPVVTSKASNERPTESKYFGSNSTPGAVSGGQTSRKRSWDDRSGSSAYIFDLFQRTPSAESAAARESMKAKSPAAQQRTAAGVGAAGTSTSSSSTAAASSSSSALMVSCPVCQAQVQESKINQHLDSCLS
uniref:DNA-dependent metalloprotease SPRTN n=1 Tax=Cynoglossus semilaevis TaxID=244447 RepID=A0A3P8UXJ6_CYNSE